MSDQTEQEAIEQQKDAHLVAQALADSGRASGSYAFNRYAGRHGALVAHHARLKEVAAETARQLSEAQLEIEGLKEKLAAAAIVAGKPTSTVATNADAAPTALP